MISTVSVDFEKFEGYLETTTGDFTDAIFNFSAEIDSKNTNNKDRDTYLK